RTGVDAAALGTGEARARARAPQRRERSPLARARRRPARPGAHHAARHGARARCAARAFPCMSRFARSRGADMLTRMTFPHLERAWFVPAAVLAAAIAAAGCSPGPEPDRAAAAPAASSFERAPTVADAEAFVAAAETELESLTEYASRAAWVQANFITFDTRWLAAKATAEWTELAVRLAAGAERYRGLELPQALERKLNMLRTGITLPAPSRPGAAQELAELSTWLESAYSTGTYTHRGETLDLTALERIIDT